MKKIVRIVGVALFLCTFQPYVSYSQANVIQSGEQNNRANSAGTSKEYRIAFSKPAQAGKVKIYAMNDIEVQTHSGKDVVITATGVRSVPKRAEGLKPVYNSMVDNTNMGLAVKEVDNAVEIISVTRRSDARYKILIPSNASIIVQTEDHDGPDIRITNFTNEIEINSKFGNVELEDVTGPALVHNVHGRINVKFAKVNPKSPISITSVHGDVDVTLPAKTPANLELKSNHGEIYTDLDIAFNNTKDNMRMVSGNKISGKVNGGGVEIFLESTHSNIYLRKGQ